MKTQQRGSGWSIALVFSLYKMLGYKFIYYLMYPVTFFYFIFASNVKESLKIYYKNIGLDFNNKIYYDHLRVFAICMVDRFISKVDAKSYNYLYDDIQTPTKILNNGTILLYSHFGGWAASSSSAHVTNKINIVMQEVLLDGIKKIEDDLDIKENINIIDLNQGTLSVSIQIANALMDNEIVAIMADRASNEKAELAIDFFGKNAKFNKNPFQIAYKMDKPILVYFIALVGMQKYKVEYIIVNIDKNLTEDEAILKAMKEYTNKYQQMLLKYPNQWFNFYNFWE
jgi:predicted LPLAT superfamily acyltransferase